MISAAELAAMQSMQAEAMPDTCVRNRTVLTSDSMGGSTAGAPATVTYDCRLSSRGVPDEYLAMDRASGKQLWMVTLPISADVLTTDYLTVNGVEMEILGFVSGGTWATAKRVVCVEAK
jgi:hypothetical protein